MQLSEFLKEGKIRGAVLDMDGTLADSMPLWNGFYGLLAERLKIRIPPEFLMRANSLPMQKRMPLIFREFSLQGDADAVYEEWSARVVESYRSRVNLKPFMLQALQTLRAAGVKIAAATASDKRCAFAFFERYGISDFFSAVVDVSEVRRDKSFPDIYLKAAQILGVQPSECLVFEDTLTTVKSAKSGGFSVCAVQDAFSASDESEIRRLCDFELGFSAVTE